jgi:hypothetical protein
MKSLRRVLLLSLLLALSAFAIQPIRNIQISVRGKTYQFRDVTTVSELQERLFEASGLNETLVGHVEFKGKSLQPNDVLRLVGVKEGAKLTLVVTGEKKKNNNNNPSLKEMLEDWNGAVDLKNLLNLLQAVNREEVASLMREGMEQTYHILRQKLDNPAVRKGWNDPRQIENFRQSILKDPNMKTIIQEMNGVSKDLLNNADSWRDYVQSLNEVATKAGDAVLDGMLEVVLDVLRGSSSSSGQAARRGEGKSGDEDLYNFNRNMDASITTNVLFELSESEDE